MSWTYSGDPAFSAKDEVRFLMGDTISTDPQVQDQEIAWLLTETHNDTTEAAARAMESLGARYARQADKTVGDLSIKMSQIADAYQKAADELRQGVSFGTGAIAFPPFAGGTSVGDKYMRELDSDRPVPAFARGQHDFDKPQETVSPRGQDGV